MRRPCIRYKRPNLLLFPQVMVPLRQYRPRPAARSQNTESFSKYAFLLWRKIDNTIGDDYVYAFVCHRKSFNFALAKFDIVESIPLRVLASFGQHFRSHVDANYFPGWSDGASGQETIKSCAGSQIEDSLSSFQRGDAERITTTQAEVRGFRHKRGIFGGVTKGIAAGGSAAILGTGRFPTRAGAITLPYFPTNRV